MFFHLARSSLVITETIIAPGKLGRSGIIGNGYFRELFYFEILSGIGGTLYFDTRLPVLRQGFIFFDNRSHIFKTAITVTVFKTAVGTINALSRQNIADCRPE